MTKDLAELIEKGGSKPSYERAFLCIEILNALQK